MTRLSIKIIKGASQPNCATTALGRASAVHGNLKPRMNARHKDTAANGFCSSKEPIALAAPHSWLVQAPTASQEIRLRVLYPDSLIHVHSGHIKTPWHISGRQ